MAKKFTVGVINDGGNLIFSKMTPAVSKWEWFLMRLQFWKWKMIYDEDGEVLGLVRR